MAACERGWWQPGNEAGGGSLGMGLLLPRARMREAGLSNQFCPSVSRLSVVCQAKKIEILPHRPP